jgi:hypothetical protein
MMEELHTCSIDGGHEACYGARSHARERAYSNKISRPDPVLGPGHSGSVWPFQYPEYQDQFDQPPDISVNAGRVSIKIKATIPKKLLPKTKVL